MKPPSQFQKFMTDEQVKQVQALQAVFTALRQGERPLRKIPASVRAQVLRAIAAGVPPVAIRNACKVGWSQIRNWKPKSAQKEIIAPRVLSVVEPPKQKMAVDDDRIEIGIGSWRVSISRTA